MAPHPRDLDENSLALAGVFDSLGPLDRVGGRLLGGERSRVDRVRRPEPRLRPPARLGRDPTQRRLAICPRP